MPVIVIGADTSQGRAVIEGLVEPGREVRAFVSDPAIGAELRELGVKVALGDVSDDSHVQGFLHQLLHGSVDHRGGEMVESDPSPPTRNRCWRAGLRPQPLRRHPGDLGTRWSAPAGSSQEVGTVSPGHPDLVAEVAALDDARFLPQ